MCLALYLGTHRELALLRTQNISVEETENIEQVKRIVAMPHCYLIGSHTSCSCGFPSVMAEEPIDYYEGMFQADDDRLLDLLSTRELFELLAIATHNATDCVLFPHWLDGCNETQPAKGNVHLSLSDVTPETFVLTQQFRYVVSH
jgi:hypothetical protein